MIALLSRPLAALAAIGWALSVVVSVVGLAGASLPPSLMGALTIGLFPLWLCAVLLTGRLTEGAPQRDFWKAALRGCPDWLRYAIWGSWGYSFIMFALIVSGKHEAGGVGFVGVFYASALGIFITGARTGSEPRACANGHKIGPFDNFCRECGSAINRSNATDPSVAGKSRRASS